jgi:hypothetical protein
VVFLLTTGHVCFSTTQTYYNNCPPDLSCPNGVLSVLFWPQKAGLQTKKAGLQTKKAGLQTMRELRGDSWEVGAAPLQRWQVCIISQNLAIGVPLKRTFWRDAPCWLNNQCLQHCGIFINNWTRLLLHNTNIL